jgi:hypothetical protein
LFRTAAEGSEKVLMEKATEANACSINGATKITLNLRH